MNRDTIMAAYGVLPLPENPTEAMAYVPFQPYAPEICQATLGYENGTVFRSLHKPFYGKQCGGVKDD